MRVLLIEPSTYTPSTYAQRADESKVLSDARALPILRLTLPYLAALMPDQTEVMLAYDACENIEDDDDLSSFDLVGISCTSHTGQIKRAQELANILKKQEILSIVGGPVTIQESQRYVSLLSHAFDAVVVGEAESVLGSLIGDAEKKALKKVYRNDDFVPLRGIPIPRFDLVNFDLFTPPHVFPAMTARGCPRRCTFCSEFIYGSWRLRPVDEVIAELISYQEEFGAEKIVFRDDDFLVNPDRSRELLSKMISLGLEWACQTDLHLTRNLDIAELAIEAGLRSVCFGLESVRLSNRVDIGKDFFSIEGACELLSMLYEQGVETQINIIFGLDHDTPDIFDETVDYLLTNRVSTFFANILTPEPGTSLFKKMQDAGRLLDIHTLEIEDPANLNYMPKNLTPEQLVNGTRYARKRFHSERKGNLNFWLGPHKTEY